MANRARPAGFGLNPVEALRVLTALLVFVGCGQPAAGHLADARAALADAAYPDAIASAEAGLGAGGDAATVWGLDLVLLEAHARAGHGERAREQLAKLGAEHPDRIQPSEYSATAHQLKLAGDGPSAIAVLDLGAKRFPQDPLISKLIADSAASGSDPAELEMLRSLGYIE